MQTNRLVRRVRRGVSLVELLTALTVTAVIGGIMIGGGMKVVTLATNARISIEISRLAGAIEDFAMYFGDYPPDFTNAAALEAFLRQHFPKCPRKNYPSFAGQSPASALYFWLAGPHGRGFSANPENPFDNGPRRIGPFLDFARDRLKPMGNALHYVPPTLNGNAPYVYFRANKNGYAGNSGWPPARPYRDSETGLWIHPDSYQILCAGEDGRYGAGSHFPGGADYDEANLDDITNFSRGGTLEQAMKRPPSSGRKKAAGK